MAEYKCTSCEKVKDAYFFNSTMLSGYYDKVCKTCRYRHKKEEESKTKYNNKCLRCDEKWQDSSKEWFCLNCKESEDYKNGCDGHTVYL